MKFSCEKLMFLSAILTASRVVAAKSTVPELEGLLIMTAENSVRISGFDLKTGITTTVDADIEQEGGIVLNSKLFCEIIRRLPDGFVTLTSDESNLTVIECMNSEFNIMGSPAHNYPELPLLDKQDSAIVPGNMLREMIAQTKFAISDNEARPVHTGALFEIENGELTVVAVDGYRLALRREKLEDGTGGPLKFVAPGTALGEVERISSGEDVNCVISLGSKHVMFSIDNTVLITRRLEGEFLNYRSSIPQSIKYELKVEKRTFIDAVERVALIVNDKQKGPLRCIFGADNVKLNAMSTLGRANDECPAEGDGENLEIGFNDKFLLEALRAAPSDIIKLRLISGITPCLITPPEGEEKFVYMILPVRLRANEG
jgi:DNA polymerase-3 subunit beta